MKLVIDMNLSPEWVRTLKSHGFSAVHWSAVGNPAAKDEEILRWARDHAAIVITNDLTSAGSSP